MKESYFRYKISDFNLGAIVVLLLSVCLVSIAFYLTSVFLVFNEGRLGYQMFDPVLMILPEIDLSRIIFVTTYSAIFLGLLLSINSLGTLLATLQSIFILLVMRMICMSMVPLEPPIDIIPLQDDFLSNTFYDGQVLLKDLFFSGHTASIALLAFIIQDKMWSRLILILSVVVGSMLILQHVHYTLDVLCAFIFAYWASQLGYYSSEKSLILGRFFTIQLIRRRYLRL